MRRIDQLGETQEEMISVHVDQERNLNIVMANYKLLNPKNFEQS
jgi:hypothetical protein